MAYMASELRKLVNSMGNHFVMLKKSIPRVNQHGNPSGTAVYALMLHFFGFHILRQKQAVNTKTPFQVPQFLKRSWK